MLGIDGHGYSPTILHRILHLAGVTSSFDVAEVALKVVGEIAISDRQINKLTTEVGEAMAAERDARTEEYVRRPLPRPATSPEVPIDLAAVFCDGGRMRTRQPDRGRGVHQPHWRETKNAAFHRMYSRSSPEDPQPELPDCFANQAGVEKLVHGLKGLQNEGRKQEAQAEPPSPAGAGLEETLRGPSPPWQPETLFHTCLSSLASSDDFGPMMAAEADARGFFAARKRAFVGDGLGYNWSIQRRWFAGFVPITDFVHVVEYAYAAAKAVHAEPSARWTQYLAWAGACWQGRGEEVVASLKRWQARLGPPPEGVEVPDSDPRKVLQSTITYLTNNRRRMDYPRYRREGLPVTSSLAESLVKQVNQRVKGTEKFWNDGPSGEAILQIRSAVISEDDRLQKWIRSRPISPFSPRCRDSPPATGA